MNNLEQISSAKVAGFGKFYFFPPELPDMSLIVFRKDGSFQAVCIDVEIDAVGGSEQEACKNLARTLNGYIKQMVNNYDGDKKAAIEDIVKVAFAEGKTKSLLYARYLQAKHQYVQSRIARENKARSRWEEFVVFCKKAFPFFQPIRFSLATAA